jgi:hypothetical protein
MEQRHPTRPDLQALYEELVRARGANRNRDHAGPPSRSPQYLAYLDQCEAEREARRAYFDACRKAGLPGFGS